MIRFALLILSLAISGSGCASKSVHMTINSVKNSPIISKTMPMVFPKKDPGVEHEKLRRECEAAAIIAKINVVKTCETAPCNFAVVSGETGKSNSEMATHYNSYTKQYFYSADTVTERKIKISVYSDIEQKNLVWEAAVDSSGQANNVLSVAKEVCYGGFLNFPEEVTARKEKVRAL